MQRTSMPSVVKPSHQTPHQLWDDPSSSTRGISIAGWDISTRKKPILNATEIEEAGTRLSIPLPEITFGNNLVSLVRKSSDGLDKGKQRAGTSAHDDGEQGEAKPATATATPRFRIIFDTLDALATVDETGSNNVKVAYADEWASSRSTASSAPGTGGDETGSTRLLADGSEIGTVKNFDWTYTNTYPGSTAGNGSSASAAADGNSATDDNAAVFQEASPDHPGIPLHKLARQDEPILFYDDVTLFEDELHDNGIANLSVKIRVMPSSFFLLARFFLRVDNVLFRIHDVRLYHEFASSEVIRETKGKEATYAEVKKRIPGERPDDLTPLTDSNWVANVLGMLEQDARTTTSQSSATGAASFTRAPGAEMGGTGAPWAASALTNNAMNGRRQVAPGVSLPVRTPMLPQPQAAPITSTASPSVGASAQTQSPQAKGRKAWQGLGTKLEVARLG